MNKLLPVLVVVVVVIVGVSFLTKQKVGNLGPAVLPPKQQVGEETSLKIPVGFKIGIFAKGVSGARDLEFSPGGTLLVSQTGEGKVVALPDKNNDGTIDEPHNVLTGLTRPHGFAFYPGGSSSAYKDKLFVAQETSVIRYSWDEANLKATQEKVLFSLPKGDRHFTRSLVFDRDGRMFVSIGSTCDVCREKNDKFASVIVSDADGNNPHVWASGLRNSVFITINPKTNELWGTEMGRDWLGDNLPPDEVNIIREGKNYGWPLCYGNRKHDIDFDKNVYVQIIPQPPCGTTESPIYEIPAHSAPLGLTFDGNGDLLVSYHGSWNRSTPDGYKVVKLDVEGDSVKGSEDFVTGFLPASPTSSGREPRQGGPSGASGANQAYGRPVDLIFDKMGSLYLSDDKAGFVYKIVKE